MEKWKNTGENRNRQQDVVATNCSSCSVETLGSPIRKCEIRLAISKPRLNGRHKLPRWLVLQFFKVSRWLPLGITHF